MNKKIFHLLLTFVAVAMMLESCSPSVKGENGKSYTSYTEACSDREFGAAHKLIDALRESDKWPQYKREDEYHKAYDYIFDEETLYLIEQGDEGSADRIILLLEEYDRKFEHYKTNDRFNKLLSTTITLENITLLKKLVINQHNEDIIWNTPFSTSKIFLSDVIRFMVEHGEIEAAFTSLRKLGKCGCTYNHACDVLLDYSLEQGNFEDAQKILDDMYDVSGEYEKKQYDDAEAKFNRYYKSGK